MNNFLTATIEKNKRIQKQLKDSGIDLSMFYMLNRKLIIDAHDMIIKYVCGTVLPSQLSFDNEKVKNYFVVAHEELYDKNGMKKLNIKSSVAPLTWFLKSENKEQASEFNKLISQLYDARNLAAHTDKFSAGFSTFEETESSLNEIANQIEKITQFILSY